MQEFDFFVKKTVSFKILNTVSFFCIENKYNRFILRKGTLSIWQWNIESISSLKCLKLEFEILLKLCIVSVKLRNTSMHGLYLNKITI